MIEIRNKQIVIDGVPRIVMSGEIHYFRVPRASWQDRLDKLKAAGCNTVASYVPWLCHEPADGKVDLEGETRAELDLGAFIDLCKQNGLWFFARPGPFIMAEMKNEGLPYWVAGKHPEIAPVGWDGASTGARAVDYLAPGFLYEARKWYAAVMRVLAPRLHARGGNVIAVQLDNEIGMLAWVCNCPGLTDDMLADFSDWLERRYGAEDLARRYSFDPADAEIRRNRARSPVDGHGVRLMRDLGHYMRNRFSRYVATLRAWAEEFGVKDVPFVINVHGTQSGRGLTFPVGISQLYEAYTQAPGYLPGSDFYLGNLTPDNFQDLYVCNAFMDCVQTADQPLSSVEFECGDGDYGHMFGNRYDPSAVDLKTRMCIAQGNRMLNYYLFAGGHNYRLDPAPNDGNDRIAITGERHGVAAPVGPEGALNYTYPRMARVIETMMAVSDKLAVAEEERDAVALAFIPDYFMTEYRYPGNPKIQEIMGNLEANRGRGAWECMVRAMLLAGYRFGAIDIQNRALDPKTTPVLALASARYMDGEVQRRLVEWLRAGGGLLLYGEVPLFDMEGEGCTLLAEALGAMPTGARQASEDYYLSVCADGWAAPRPEIRTHFAQVFAAGGAGAFLRVYDTREVCGFGTSVGKGRALVITTAYPCDVSLFRAALERLGAAAGLRHDCAQSGIFMTSTATGDGERFLHILNLDGFDKELRLYDNGRPLLDGRKLTLQARDGVMLPLGVSFHGVRIEYSTAEILRVERDAISFRLTQAEDIVALETGREPVPSDDYRVRNEGRRTVIVSRKHARVDDRLTLRFKEGV
ncbi:beta-galactosidase [Methylocaldum sp. MU1018]